MDLEDLFHPQRPFWDSAVRGKQFLIRFTHSRQGPQLRSIHPSHWEEEEEEGLMSSIAFAFFLRIIIKAMLTLSH